jgi:RNA polymerase sigma-70 factor (ECF subfamily)
VPTQLHAAPSDEELVAGLRQRDEAAFAQLVDRHHAALVRLARSFVRDAGLAEEIAQDAWLRVLRGIDGFEGRSSLRTWLYAIVANRARSLGGREARSVPFSAIGDGDPSVDPERFLDDSHRYAGNWAAPPARWPEDRLIAEETRTVITTAIDALPPLQRSVIMLRDVDGATSEETCEVLRLSDGNQRVLLHRARSHVRRVLERYLDEEAA